VIPKEDFQKCFQQWQERWNKCVCVPEESTLKGIRDEIGIQSFTELFDRALQMLCLSR
jgi:hypothetical protein